MSDVAASGGYMASLSAVSIFADPFTITGSIGVVAGKLNFRKLMDRVGIGSETITRGKMSSIYSVTKPFSEEEKKKHEGIKYLGVICPTLLLNKKISPSIGTVVCQ